MRNIFVDVVFDRMNKIKDSESYIREYKKIKRNIENRLKNMSEKKDMIRELKMRIASEYTPEFIAGGVLLGEKAVSDSEFKDLLKELLSASDNKSHHRVRHAMISLGVYVAGFNKKQNENGWKTRLGKEENVVIREISPFEIVDDILSEWERKGTSILEWFLTNKELTKKRLRDRTEKIKEEIRKKEKIFNKSDKGKESIEKHIEYLREEEKLINDLIHIIDLDKEENDINKCFVEKLKSFFSNIPESIWNITIEEGINTIKRDKDFKMYYGFFNIIEEKKENIIKDSWQKASFMYAIPFLYDNDYYRDKYNWKNIIRGIVYDYEGMIEVLPHVLALFVEDNYTDYKEHLIESIVSDREYFESLIDTLCNKVDSIHLVPSLIDFLYFLQKVKRLPDYEEIIKKSIIDRLNKEIPYDYQKFNSIAKEYPQDKWDRILYKFIASEMVKDIKTTINVISPFYQSLLYLYVGEYLNDIYRLLDLSVEYNNLYYISKFVRTLKDRMYRLLGKKHLYGERGKDYINREKYIQLYLLQNITKKWNLSEGTLQKDLGALISRLIYIEIEYGREENAKKWIYTLLWGIPEKDIIMESREYLFFYEGEKDKSRVFALLENIGEYNNDEEDNMPTSIWRNVVKQIYNPADNDVDLGDFELVLWGKYFSKFVSEVSINIFMEKSSTGIKAMEKNVERKIREDIKQLNMIKNRIKSIKEDYNNKNIIELIEEKIELMEKLKEYFLSNMPYYYHVSIENKFDDEFIIPDREMLNVLKNGTDVSIKEMYMKKIRENTGENKIGTERGEEQEGFLHLFSLEKVMLYRYMLDDIAEQIMNKFEFLMYKYVFGIFSVLFLPILWISFILEKYVWEKFDIFGVCVILMLFVFLMMALFSVFFIIKEILERRGSRKKKYHNIRHIEKYQLFLPKYLAMIVFAETTSFYADETWAVMMAKGVYSLILSLIFAVLVYLFIKEKVENRSVYDERIDNRKEIKIRAFRIFSMSLFYSFVVNILYQILDGASMIRRVEGDIRGTFLAIPMIKEYTLPLLGKLTVSPWFLFVNAIYILFIGVVLQMFLNKEELE